MCGGVHYGEADGLVSVERWSCSRGASCTLECSGGNVSAGVASSVVLQSGSRHWTPTRAPPQTPLSPSVSANPSAF